MPTLFDSTRQHLTLGREIGSGGEGTVYDVVNRTNVVAKVYRQGYNTQGQLDKLMAMVNLPNASQLKSFSAWPEELLFNVLAESLLAS